MDRVLIIGGSGLVGGNCFSYFQSKVSHLIATHKSFPTENTIYYNCLECTTDNLRNLAGTAPFDAIVYTAGLTHVDYCEKHIHESYSANVQALKNLVNSIDNSNTKLIYISSDYVFNGSDGPYDEGAIPKPLNIYGQHKKEAEEFIQDHIVNHLIVRITNVYGNETRNKNFISRLLIQLIEKKPMQLFLPYDQYASPINAWDIARAIFRLVEADKRGIFHLAGTDYYSRFHLAIRVAKYFTDHALEINPVRTEDMSHISTKRPLKGGLIANKFMNNFPDFIFTNVDDYIQSKVELLD